MAISHENVNLEMITTVGGNVPVNTAYKNAERIVNIGTSKTIPVYKGREKQIVHELPSKNKNCLENKNSEKINQKNTQTETDAIEALTDKIMNNPHRMTLVATAPLTNIAEAMEKKPEIKNNLEKLIIMGGAIKRSGNITPAAEFNIFIDPEAGKKVINTSIPTTLITLDITTEILFKEKHFEEIKRSETEIGDYAEKILEPYLKKYKTKNYEGCPLHDPIAMAVAINEEIATTEPLLVEIKTEGKVSRGKTVADLGMKNRRKNSNINYCTEIDRKKFFKLFIETFK